MGHDSHPGCCPGGGGVVSCDASTRRVAPMHDTPASLLERLRGPADQAAWVRFTHLYTPLLYHWAKRLGLRPDDATDLVQDVLTALVRELPRFEYDRGGSFRGWLRVVTINRWRNNHRRRTE